MMSKDCVISLKTLKNFIFKKSGDSTTLKKFYIMMNPKTKLMTIVSC